MLAVAYATAQIGTTNDANKNIKPRLKSLNDSNELSCCQNRHRSKNSPKADSGSITISVLPDHSKRRNDSHSKVVQARNRLIGPLAANS